MNAMHPNAQNPQEVLSFLEALRSALIRTGVLVAVFSVGGYLAAEPIVRFLQRLTGVKLVAYGIPETFFAFLTLALGTGVFASIPFVLYSILAPLPGLFPTLRRKTMVFFWVASILLFYAGAAFSLLVSLPYGIQFLLSFEAPRITALISVRKFISFCLLMVFGFGLIFELPLSMMLLGRIGLVGAGTLSRYRRYAVLAISIVAAVLTPTPDIFNMALMGVPLYLLFELGLLGMRLW
ncbi:MAG: twin-arginine translocase subunit TatC [Desulfobacterales bacterium]